MMEVTIGQIVYSKRGRDRGNVMIVCKTDAEYVYLVDGRLRTLDKPKKKKIKHIQPTNNIADMTTDGRALQDADIRKQLIPFVNREGGNPHCQRTM